MRFHTFPGVAALATVLALFVQAGVSQAQIQNITSSDIQGYFGSLSDVFQQNEGPNLAPWGVAGPGFYPITGVPSVPPLYPTFPNPVIPTPNIPYDAPAGHGLGTPFTDGVTSATYYAIGGFNGAGTSTSDAYVDIGVPGAIGLDLNQPPPATGYAYEQVNFAMAYSVGGAGTLAGLPGPRPLQVTGNVLVGGYAQFAAQVNYWFVTTTPGTVIINSSTFLGSLDYNFTINNVTGPFSSFVNYTSSGIAGATGAGYIVVTGDAFVTGDPFNIQVTSVPEPATVVLLAFGLAGLALHAIRRRRASRR